MTPRPLASAPLARALVAAALATVACAKPAAPPDGGPATAQPTSAARRARDAGAARREQAAPADCFDVGARAGSPVAREVFRERECQGGGVTWAAILRAIVARRGRTSPAPAAGAPWTGDVRALAWRGGSVPFAIDDEGDVARFCTASAALRDEVRADVARAEADRAALLAAMAEADPADLECEADPRAAAALRAPPFPAPTPPPAELAARAAATARVEAALARHRTWCWREGARAFGARGRGLTLEPGGVAREVGVAGDAGVGRWAPEPDGRVEVIVPGGLHHLDVRESGRLGFSHTAGREELDPCDP